MEAWYKSSVAVTVNELPLLWSYLIFWLYHYLLNDLAKFGYNQEVMVQPKYKIGSLFTVSVKNSCNTLPLARSHPADLLPVKKL